MWAEGAKLKKYVLLNIYQDILKITNLPHKRGFIDSQTSSTVNKLFVTSEFWLKNIDN